MLLRSCFDLFEMFFEVKKSSFSSRFFSQTAPLSSLEEAVEPEVFHSRPSDIKHLVNISAYFVETEVFHSQSGDIRHLVNISAYFVETEVFHSQPSAIRHLVNISAYSVETEVFHSQSSDIRHLVNISAYSVETEVFHSQPSARTEGNRTCSDCRGEQQGKNLLLTFKQTIQNSF